MKLCCNCGMRMIYLQDFGGKGKCKKCYNSYMKDYSKTKRWLNGTDNRDDMGISLKVWLKSTNGNLKIII